MILKIKSRIHKLRLGVSYVITIVRPMIGRCVRRSMVAATWLTIFICVIALMGFVSRNYTGLGHLYKPVGKCLQSALDLNDPVPFSKFQFANVEVGVAFSGGGSRAAYLAAAVLREIHGSNLRLEISDQSQAETALLSQVNAMSAVSGGSLAAAYFVANRETLLRLPAQSPDWDEYLDKMAVSYRRQEWYTRAIFNPLVLFKLIFTNYNRGLLARDDYDQSLFRGATVADLPDRPALYLNSFDVANHVRFVFSKHYIDTTFYQPRDYWGKLSEPQEITSENDLDFCRIDPRSVKIADAVYASSAFPMAYPNLAVNHCGSKILFQGQILFLADGGLADNSGLVTLLTQLKAAMEPRMKSALVLVLYIDASTGRINPDGSQFQQRGIEDTYAWRDTAIGNGVASIESANDLVQDLTWKFVESTGVVTDQLNLNWQQELKAKPRTESDFRVSWEPAVKRGTVALRPLVIRLGLRDLADPNFGSFYSGFLNQKDPRLQQLLAENRDAQVGAYEPVQGLPARLQQIKTDFALTDADRHALDLAAYLLVNGKLAGDINAWVSVAKSVNLRRGLNQTR